MHTITMEPLTAAAFSDFGEVLVPPQSAGRGAFCDRLSSLRPDAPAHLSLARLEDAAALPLIARQMERHPYSSQTFVPVGEAPFVVLIAPHTPAGGGPDMARARAFLAADGLGITYAADTWHHPMTVLAAPATFAIFMWMDGTASDQEFVEIAPMRVTAAGSASG